ncbi:hypothetical protein J2X17_002428 [Flavobacterium aquidurense]|nr:hypothetical protein [Flavobacterium aquidurense]
MLFFLSKIPRKKNIMENMNKIKVLIVGITTVLLFSNVDHASLRKGKVMVQITVFQINIDNTQ